MEESRKKFEQVYEQLRKDGQTINLWDVWSMAWEKSRAAIEITVPANDFGNASSPPGEGWNFGEASEVMDDMRNAGIKIKVRE